MAESRTPDADRAVVRGDEPPSARVRLSKERILEAALTYIEEHGLPTLTMRRLGQELGVEAMALYRHVPSKEDLLDGVVESLVAGIQQDDDVIDAPQDGWQDFLQRLAHGVRRMALAHPKAFPLVASRPPEAPWLRPPLRSLEWVETFLAALIDEGFSEDAAVAGYRAYTSFLLGHLLLEVSSLGADVGPLDVLDDQTGEPGLEDFPHVATAAPTALGGPLGCGVRGGARGAPQPDDDHPQRAPGRLSPARRLVDFRGLPAADAYDVNIWVRLRRKRNRRARSHLPAGARGRSTRGTHGRRTYATGLAPSPSSCPSWSCSWSSCCRAS